MRKNKVYGLIILVLGGVALILLLNRNQGTIRKELKNFAIDDTSTVTRIFMADKANQSVELMRTDSGWRVNKLYGVRSAAINMLLKTLLNVDIMEPVPKPVRNNVIRRIASSGVKVEIYQKVFRINIFDKITLFPHEKLVKTYYVGSGTQDNLGSYMIMEKSDVPFITFLPGFRGYIAVRYSPRLEDWRDHVIFQTAISDIQSVRVEFLEVPGFSHEVRRAGERAFALSSLYSGHNIPDFDTMKVLNYLTSFSNIQFEVVVTGFSQQKVDSIRNSKPFHRITLQERSGKRTVVETYHRQNPLGTTDESGNLTPFDRDRMYAVIDKGKELVLIQFFVFDPILLPLEAFLKKPFSSGVATGR